MKQYKYYLKSGHFLYGSSATFYISRGQHITDGGDIRRAVMNWRTSESRAKLRRSIKHIQTWDTEGYGMNWTGTMTFM
jgi:hypothetical protein